MEGAERRIRMSAYIFMDESGDLGFSKGSSKWFLFTIVIVSDKRVLERVIRKVWKPLKKKHQRLGELHAYHANPVTRRRVLNGIREIDDLKVLTIILNKQKVYVDLQNQKNYLYNYTANILLERLHETGIIEYGQDIHLCIDRKDTKERLRENFLGYLSRSMDERLEERMGERRNDTFHACLEASHDNKSLQAVDFVSWAIFRKYEQSDYEYYELIKDKITDEKILFA